MIILKKQLFLKLQNSYFYQYTNTMFEEIIFDFGVNVLSDDEEPQSVVDDVCDEVLGFLQDNATKSTGYNTTSCVKRINTFMNDESKRNYSAVEFHLLPSEELDALLCDFYMHAMKKSKKKDKENNDELYQPDTLNNFRNGWQRYLTDINSKIDIKKDKCFDNSRSCRQNS